MGKLIDILNEVIPFGYIKEAGLSRLITRVNGKDFAVASAWKGYHDKAKNKTLQRELHDFLKGYGMGGYRLVGYWREAPKDGDYSQATDDQLTDVVEDSVLFVKPDKMNRQEFMGICVEINQKFDQDSVVLGLSEDGEYEYKPTDLTDPKKRKDAEREGVPNMNVYLIDKIGKLDKIGSRLTLNTIAQAYSRMRGREDIPFVFEGVIHPINNISRQLFKVNNALYLKD